MEAGSFFLDKEAFKEALHEFRRTTAQPLVVRSTTNSYIRVVCCKGIKERKSKSKGMRTSKRKNAFTGCEAKIIANIDTVSGQVRISSSDLNHNHNYIDEMKDDSPMDCSKPTFTRLLRESTVPQNGLTSPIFHPSIQVGSLFANRAIFKEVLLNYRDATFQPLVLRSSHPSGIRVCCTHGTAPSRQSTAKIRLVESKSKFLNCQAKIIAVGPPEGELRVVSMDTQHNHAISEEIYQQYSFNRRLSHEDEERAKKLLAARVKPWTIAKLLSDSSGRKIMPKTIYNLRAVCFLSRTCSFYLFIYLVFFQAIRNELPFYEPMNIEETTNEELDIEKEEEEPIDLSNGSSNPSVIDFSLNQSPTAAAAVPSSSNQGIGLDCSYQFEVGGTFPSKEVFKSCLEEFRKDTLQPFVIRSTQPQSIRVLCTHGVQYRPGKDPSLRLRQRQRKTKYCGCEAKILATIVQRSGMVRITSVNFHHNHVISEEDFKGFSITRRLTTEEQNMVADLTLKNYESSEIARIISENSNKMVTTKMIQNVKRKQTFPSSTSPTMVMPIFKLSQ